MHLIIGAFLMGYLVTCIVIGLIVSPFTFSTMQMAVAREVDTKTAFKWGVLSFVFMAIGLVFVVQAQPEHGVDLLAFVFRLCSAAAYFIIVVASMVKGFGLI